MAAQLIRITSEVEVPYLTYNGQPVLTFALIDKVHNRVEGTAGRNFRSNRQRFIGKEDFYDLDSESLDEIRRNHPGVIGEAAQHATLITESGYLMLVKSFTDDLSWQIQRQLVKLYFRVKEAVEQPHPRLSPEQWQAIQEVIHGIGVCCQFGGKARFAANERIRFTFGLRLSNELPPEHFEEAMARKHDQQPPLSF